ncbi:hypothetical protein KUV95_13300 [Microbulbifer agarilyticus]|uniref:hypothetical protein n=1 Tax=Microbulbifer agarilyticus TaxID=260552 RepID=UPI001C977DEB|nr:hypothetical protein [Microbulbifer agarilyticus]MBY6212527.1 hypothetical protein [Microbulbifer agarilyticus]
MPQMLQVNRRFWLLTDWRNAGWRGKSPSRQSRFSWYTRDQKAIFGLYFVIEFLVLATKSSANTALGKLFVLQFGFICY